MSLARLLQLASPTLPVGAYSYSQGLESAVEARIVTDAGSAERWIGEVLQCTLAQMEAPILWRMLQGEDLNELFLASRETAELRAETLQMGHSLCRLLADLGIPVNSENAAYPTAYAAAVIHWKIDPREAMIAYLWSWLENQVMAAIKCVPLGQTAGQKILLSLGSKLQDIAKHCETQELYNFAPGLACLSARHETQYSRLFRS
ncbi:MAG TPA: urease accessory UreF family protein [Burkholderiales bacterium]|nr:urease accessory UreF family protein [Burkholderiales bacterium]